jgi:hypothetical protein
LLIGLLFWVLTLASCTYAWMMGGRDGRTVAAIMVGATLATTIAENVTAWSHTQDRVLLVDAGMFIMLYVLAMRSDRFWPIWLAAFQLATVSSHVATIPMGAVSGKIYQMISTVWVIPLQLTLVLGIWQDRVAALRTHYNDADPQ